MLGYIRNEIITPFAEQSRALCVALDKSGYPDNSYFYEKIVDPYTLEQISLQHVLRMRNPMLDSDLYTNPMSITNPILQEYLPYLHLSPPPREQLIDLTPFFTTGSQKTASVLALFLSGVYLGTILRIIHPPYTDISREHLLEQALTIVLNANEALCLVTRNDGICCYSFTDDFSVQFRRPLDLRFWVQAQAAWCEENWCLLEREKSAWWLTLYQERTGDLVDKFRLAGKPDTITAAASAPIIACGLSHNRVQIFDIVTGQSTVFQSSSLPMRHNRIEVALSANGQRVAARGLTDEMLWTAACGHKDLVPLRPLPEVMQNLANGNFLVTKPGFCILNDRCLVVNNGDVTAISTDLPAILDTVW